MRDIKFLPEFIPAIERGDKTQTRRPVEPAPIYTPNDCWSFYGAGTKEHYTPTVPEYAEEQMNTILSWCPYGQPGDRIRIAGTEIMLEIIGVRVERVQEISEADAKAEGGENPILVPNYSPHPTWRDSFRDSWNRIYAAKGFGWDKNPFVWVIDFKMIQAMRAQ